MCFLIFVFIFNFCFVLFCFVLFTVERTDPKIKEDDTNKKIKQLLIKTKIRFHKILNISAFSLNIIVCFNLNM